MNVRRAIAFVLHLLIVGSVAIAADPAHMGFDPARLAAIDGLVKEAITKGEMPGCVVCIGRRDGIAVLEAWGDRAIEPARASLAPDAVFDLASLTKPVATATAVLQLVEIGRAHV